MPQFAHIYIGEYNYYLSGSVCSGAQSCLTLFDPMDCGPLGFYVHGIFQVRILEWTATSFSGESSKPSDQTCISLYLLHWQADSLPLMSPGKLRAGSVVKTKSSMIHKVLPDTHMAHTHTYFAIVKLAKNGAMPRQKLFHCSFPFNFNLIYDQFSCIPFFICWKGLLTFVLISLLLFNLTTYTVFAKHQINFYFLNLFNLYHFWSKPTKDRVPGPWQTI